jgi:hypothetical protein
MLPSRVVGKVPPEVVSCLYASYEPRGLISKLAWILIYPAMMIP